MDNDFQPTELSDKEEIIFCLEYILKDYEKEAGSSYFGLPNGTIWIYSKMLDYIKNNLV